MTTLLSKARKATPDDVATASELFAVYPFKETQRRIQGLDHGRLDAFFQKGFKRTLEAGAPHWVVEGEKGILALAGLSADPWHSDVYGLKMGKVQPWLNTVEPACGEGLLAAVEAEAIQQGLEHLSVRVDGQDYRNLHLFEAAGWRLVDVSLKFSRSMPLGERQLPNPPSSAGWQVREGCQGDRGWICRLGSQTHQATHFLNDPSLPTEKTRELFVRWLERCLEKLAYKVYTLRDTAGVGRGFVTYLRNKSFAEAVGRAPIILDFVILDPAIRGGGLGPWLIDESLRREGESGFDFCELRTSAHNLSAMTAYEKMGFLCCGSDFVLHKML